MDDDILVHFGVKGMKWGKRRQRVSDAKDNISTAKAELKAAKQELKDARKDRNRSYAKKGAVLAVGIGVATALLSGKGSTPIKAISKTEYPVAISKDWASTPISQLSNTEMFF